MACATLLAAVLIAGPRLQGSTVCPTVDEVAEQLRTLVTPEQARTATGAVATLVDGSGGVRLLLEDGAGMRLAERQLPASRDCRALAAAAAIWLAVWQGSLPVEAPVADSGDAHRAPARGRVALALGLGASGSVAPSASGDAGAAAGPVLLARARAPGMLLAAQLLLDTHSERSFRLSGGRVQGRRVTGGLGLDAAARLGPSLRAGAQLLLLASRLAVRGSGYASDRHSEAWDAGLAAGGRLFYAGESLFGWLDLGARFWPRPHAAALSPDGKTLDLPALEAGITGGIGFGSL